MASQDKIKTREKDDGLLGVASRTSIKTGDVFSDVSSLIEKARHAAYKSVNVLLIQRNWLIGKRIHEEELKDTRKENYGLEIIKSLSKRLTEKYGKGFGRMSLYNFFTFYKEYPNIFQTPFGQSFLSWSHYLVLLQVDDKKSQGMVRERGFFRVLERQDSSKECLHPVLLPNPEIAKEGTSREKDAQKSRRYLRKQSVGIH